jgi:uncharacterized protein YacL
MVLNILRALFVLLMASVGWFMLKHSPPLFGEYTWMTMIVTLSVGVLIMCLDILAPRKKLAIFSGTFLGLLVGLAIAYAFSFVTQLILDQVMFWMDNPPSQQRQEMILNCINLAVGVISCYLAISFILQTKDDFRFVIPYVEFARQARGARPALLDTSVLVDGRISELARTGLLDTRLIVPRFVQQELQALADSTDRTKRARGRRGLDVLAELKAGGKWDFQDYDSSAGHSGAGLQVDERLIVLARELDARLFTTDFNLSKLAEVRGVEAINLQEIAGVLRPSVAPGDRLSVEISKPGEEAGQGVGYLPDGTMVVVERGREHIGTVVDALVTNSRQTSAGRLVFARLADEPPPAARRQPARDPGASSSPAPSSP